MAVFKHILVPLDGSPLAECVLPHLVALADRDTYITLARVLDLETSATSEQPVSPLDWQILHAEVEAYLEQTAARLRDTGLTHVEHIILEGQPAETLIEYAQKSDVNLILMSSHGKSGVSRWNVSSVVRKIVDRALLSTMVVRAYNFDSLNLESLQYNRILVPLDGSLRAELSLTYAAAIAQRHQTNLILTHIITRPEMIQRMPPTAEDQELTDRQTNRALEIGAKYFEQLANQVPVPFEKELLVSTDVTHTLQKIIDEKQIDLVVLSAHGHSADPMRSYGNVTGALIEYGSISMITIQDLSADEIAPNRAETETREFRGRQ